MARSRITEDQVNDTDFASELEMREHVSTVSGSLRSVIDTKASISHLHDDIYYRKSEVNELVSSGTGIDLSDYATISGLNSVSGTLQSQINNKSESSHLHDGRYYIQSEVDSMISTVSGVLQGDIDTHIHDDRYYIKSTVDDKLSTLSGGLSTTSTTVNQYFTSSGTLSATMVSGIILSVLNEISLGDTKVSGTLSERVVQTVYDAMDTFYAESISESATTATTYQQKLRLPIITNYEGPYVLSYSALCSHEAIGKFINLRLQINDVETRKEVGLTMDNLTYGDGGWLSYSGNFIFESTVTGTYNVDFDYCTGQAGKAAYVKEVVLVAQRLEGNIIKS